MQFIRKILKQNLIKIDPTNDIILSVTETGELYVNNKNGDQNRLGNIITVADENALATLTPIIGKLYYIKSLNDIQYYQGGDTKPFISFKTDIIERVTVLENGVNTIKGTLTDLQAAVSKSSTDNAAAIQQVSDALTSEMNTLSQSILSHASAIKHLEERITTVENAIVTINATIITINTDIKNLQDGNANASTAITTMQNNIKTMQDSISLNTQNITTMSSDLNKAKQDILDIGGAVNTNTTDISNIKQTIAIKKYNAVYTAENLSIGDLKPDLYIKSYLFNTNQKLFIDKLILTTHTSPTAQIDFKVVHIPFNPDGSLGTPVDVSTISLSPAMFNVEKTLTQPGLSDGIIRVSITNNGQVHADASCIISITVKEITV